MRPRIALAQELRDTAANLSRMADELENGKPLRSLPPSAFFEQHSDGLRTFALKLYKLRRGREKYLTAELLGEPAWDMLLAIYCDQLSGKKTSITSACIAGNVPTSTGLRYISSLVDKRMLVRKQCEADARRSYVLLTEEALLVINRMLQTGIDLLYGPDASSNELALVEL